jgi:hypothetical protein
MFLDNAYPPIVVLCRASAGAHADVLASVETHLCFGCLAEFDAVLSALVAYIVKQAGERNRYRVRRIANRRLFDIPACPFEPGPAPSSTSAPPSRRPNRTPQRLLEQIAAITGKRENASAWYAAVGGSFSTAQHGSSLPSNTP